MFVLVKGISSIENIIQMQIIETCILNIGYTHIIQQFYMIFFKVFLLVSTVDVVGQERDFNF